MGHGSCVACKNQQITCRYFGQRFDSSQLRYGTLDGVAGSGGGLSIHNMTTPTLFLSVWPSSLFGLRTWINTLDSLRAKIAARDAIISQNGGGRIVEEDGMEGQEMDGGEEPLWAVRGSLSAAEKVNHL